jgi:hypothetical protein
VDKTTIDLGITFEIKVLELDKMCKIVHVVIYDQVVVSQTQ